MERVDYATVNEITVSQDDAEEVYAILGEYTDLSWPVSSWHNQITTRWGEGEDLTDLVRLLVGTAYRLQYQYLLRGYPMDARMIALCKGMYDAVGIEPPRATRRKRIWETDF